MEKGKRHDFSEGYNFPFLCALLRVCIVKWLISGEDQLHGSDTLSSGDLGFLNTPGEMALLIQGFDWSTTALDAVEHWPQSLKAITGFLVRSPVPIVLLWGADGVMIYNDSYAVFAGGRHPDLLGKKVREGWPEVADFNDNITKVGLAGGTLAYKDQELILHRTGKPEQVWMNLDYSPVLGESGRPAGVIAIVIETTDRVLADRRAAAEQERQRQMLGQMPGFVCVVRGPEHIYEYVNDAYVKISGRENFVGRSVREMFPELEGQGYYELLDYSTGGAVLTRGMELRLAGSEEVQFIDFVYEPIRNETGEVTGIFVGGYEVTEVHRSAAALRESEARLRELNAELERKVIERYAGAGPNMAGQPGPAGCTQFKGLFRNL
jgi:PAS domain-containing protein